MKFAVPFQVKDGIIYDAEGKKVKLWGVNYYMPFNHNYFNTEELGKNHFAAIDEDIRHFKLMDVDFIRMHMYEREITTFDGHLVENHQMEVFDYLIDQCEKNGIYLMICPISYWNTVKNQIILDRQYAYWNIYAQDAFGFTNFYSVDSLVWHPEAQNCHERYVKDLFARRNKFSGRRFNEYPNIVAWELVNEIIFPGEFLLHEDLPVTPDHMSLASYSRGALRLEFVEMWEKYHAEHPESCFKEFTAGLVENYLNRFWRMVDQYFGKQVIKAQFDSHSGIPAPELVEILERVPYIDSRSINTYLNVNNFEATSTDSANHLELAEQWLAPFHALKKSKSAKISYEFDATATTNGYPLAAIGAMYGYCDVQMAAYFTYTPYSVAAWNPGWVVHFMNIAHTPSQAAGFAAAGKIFRAMSPDSELVRNTEEWHGEGFRIERKNDFVSYLNETTFCYSNDNDIELPNPGKLEYVCGRGKSKFAECDGNGCYFLQKLDENRWELNIFPKQAFLSEPCRGKVFRGMANRYINCLKEPPVSQLSEAKLNFKLNAFKLSRCTTENGLDIEVTENIAKLSAGTYILTVKAIE